ncbi:MAG: hypothetical protein J0L75_15680 [Spirochaetes bacterium]|nr:hypothetical protein [Spirochaetota bacterium]
MRLPNPLPPPSRVSLLLLAALFVSSPMARAAATYGGSIGSTVFLGTNGNDYNPSARLLFIARSPAARGPFAVGWNAGVEWYVSRSPSNVSSNWQVTIPLQVDALWRASEADWVVRPGLGIGPTFLLQSAGGPPLRFGVALVAEAKLELGVSLGHGAFVLIPAYQARFQWLGNAFALLHGLNLSVAMYFGPKGAPPPSTNQAAPAIP